MHLPSHPFFFLLEWPVTSDLNTELPTRMKPHEHRASTSMPPSSILTTSCISYRYSDKSHCGRHTSKVWRPIRFSWRTSFNSHQYECLAVSHGVINRTDTWHKHNDSHSSEIVPANSNPTSLPLLRALHNPNQHLASQRTAAIEHQSSRQMRGSARNPRHLVR